MDWFISDTHFNHANILKFAERPFDSFERMNEVMINNWNRKVSKDDTVYHLGDFGFQNKEIAGSGWALKNIFNELNGNKILIKGNHDRGPVLDLAWREIWYSNENQAKVYPYDGLDYYLVHKPLVLYPNPGIVLCGHIHQQFVYQGNNLNMSVEVWGYEPVTMEDIVSRINWLRHNVYDTNTQMKIFKKGFEEVKPPAPRS